MPNLKPKKNADGTPASISQISRMLRGKAEEPEQNEQVEEVQQQEVKPEIKEKKQQTTLVRGTELENMILEAKQNSKSTIGSAPVMIDGELYDVFALLKAKKKVAAARLVSLICRQWVKENQRELEQMLGQEITLQ